MQGLHIDLLDRCDVDKAHRWSRYGLGNRIGIQCVVLVGLGFTNWAGTILTVWPKEQIVRANQCEPGHASIPTMAGSARPKNCSNVWRRNRTRWTGLPVASTPTTWKMFLP